MKLASLEAILRALNQSGVRYLIAGGLAVAAHGYGRVTFDVDLVLQLDAQNVRQAMKALGALGYRPAAPVSADDLADPAVREGWVRDKGMVVLQMYSDAHRETTIDVFTEEPFDFESEYGRAMTGEIAPGVSARFVSIGTLIRMKEATGRDKDREDVRQLKLLMQDQSDAG